MKNCCCESQLRYATNLAQWSQWKSLPNLLINRSRETLSLQQKRERFKTRNDTLVPALERSKSMDFSHLNCDVHFRIVDDGSALQISTFDLNLSRDFTDLMNASISERSDADSSEVRTEMDGSFDCLGNLDASQLTQTNLSESLATRMYSYESLDRAGKNLYKINKWFQRCSIDNDDSEKEQNE